MARKRIEDVRRGDLIDAALNVVAEEGHDAATTQRIGARADLSPGLVHHYFGDKHALLCACFRAVRKPVAQYYCEALEKEGGRAEAALEASIAAHLDHVNLTVHRAAAWLQFVSRVAYVPDYARIQAAIRCRQIASLRYGLRGKGVSRDQAAQGAVQRAIALDGAWMEMATMPGGLTPKTLQDLRDRLSQRAF